MRIKPNNMLRPVGAAGLALSSPLFVLDYLTTPEPWHNFFGTPWFASTMSGVAFMSGLILSVTCWLWLAPKAALPPESPEATVARLLRQGDLLEVRAATIVDSGGEDAFEHLALAPFFPLPVISDAETNFKTDAPLVDVATASSGSTTSQLFEFFDAHPDAAAALGLTPCAVSGKTISLLVTRSDRIDAITGKDANQTVRCELLRAFHAARTGDEDNAPQDRAGAEGIVSLDQWRALWASFEARFAGTARCPASIFAPLPWTQEQARSLSGLPVLAHIHRPTHLDLSPRHTIVSGLRDAYERAVARWRGDRSPGRLIYDARAVAGWGGVVADALIAHRDRPPLFTVPDGVHDVMAFTDARGIDMGLTQLAAALSAPDVAETTHAMVHRVNDTHAEIVLVTASI
jgi:hypothetical protein